jgi:hypothetical protein
MCGTFRAMLSWALIVAVVISFSAACSPDSRETDIKQCIAKVQREASQGKLSPLLDTASSDDERHDIVGGFVISCMRGAGYSHGGGDLADARCVDEIAFNQYCYRRAK